MAKSKKRLNTSFIGSTRNVQITTCKPSAARHRSSGLDGWSCLLVADRLSWGWGRRPTIWWARALGSEWENSNDLKFSCGCELAVSFLFIFPFPLSPQLLLLHLICSWLCRPLNGRLPSLLLKRHLYILFCVNKVIIPFKNFVALFNSA